MLFHIFHFYSCVFPRSYILAMANESRVSICGTNILAQDTVLGFGRPLKSFY